jgi:hypothetical protein
MKGYSVNSRRANYTGKTNFLFRLKDYVLGPFMAGLVGFISFYFILIITKFLSYILGTHDSMALEWDDALLSSIGFILVFLIRFLENFKEEGS